MNDPTKRAPTLSIGYDTMLSDDLKKLEQTACQIKAHFRQSARIAIRYLNAEDLLSALAEAYRSWPEGTAIGVRAQQLADELQSLGKDLHFDYGI